MAIAAVMGIDPTAVADTPEFQLGQLGAIVDDTNGTRIYKYVQYDTGSGSVAAVSGNAAYYYTLDGYKLFKVTSDLSDSIEIGAGILQSAPTDGQYCWVQIKGMATLAVSSFVKRMFRKHTWLTWSEQFLSDQQNLLGAPFKCDYISFRMLLV